MMLTPCKSLENQQDDLSADEEMLENTKPNLISFSLSTSSSNHTVSITKNSGQRDVEAECTPECEEMGVNQLTSFDNLELSGEIKLPAFDMSVTSLDAEPQVTSITSSCRNRNANSKLFSEKVLTEHSKTKVFQGNTPIKNTTAHKSVRPSTSLCNLYDVNSLHNDMPRFASHSQLNSHQESKRSILTRSLSSVNLKHRTPTYDHVESKVKHYISQLKREKVETNEHSRESEVNVAHPRENTIVTELQQEVKRLQSYLEERDLLLREVQTNYHSLLLQYGEAKNKLDQLRFTSITPQHSVQTQPHSNIYNETSLINPYKNDQPIVLKKFAHDSENQIGSPSDAAMSLIEDKKGPKESFQILQNTELTSIQHCKFDFKAKENKESSMEKNISCSPDFATLKVSSWVSSVPCQPLPMPSCYGSLGSSGTTCNLQPGSIQSGERRLTEPPEPSWGEQPAGSALTAAQGGDLCFLPIDKCYCWPPNIIQEGRASVESVKTKMEDASLDEVLCVPPLDLQCLNGSTIPGESSVSENLFLSDESLPSVCSQQSSLDQEGPFEQTRVASKMYFETPTSYKSIVMNCERAYDKSSVPISLSRDPQNCHENGLYLKSTDIQSGHMEGDWGRKNDRRLCCLEKIMRRCCVDDLHVCCCWTKTINHQLLRCDQCVSRDSMVPSDPQMLLNLEQFLDNMSICAEGLRKRSEAIQSFLTNLLDSHL